MLNDATTQDGATKLGFTTDRAQKAAVRSAESRRSGRGQTRHPTTSEMDYDEETLDFIGAIQTFKTRSGRQFPTWGEVLKVMKSLGYERKDIPMSRRGRAIDSD